MAKDKDAGEREDGKGEMLDMRYRGSLLVERLGKCAGERGSPLVAEEIYELVAAIREMLKIGEEALTEVLFVKATYKSLIERGHLGDSVKIHCIHLLEDFLRDTGTHPLHKSIAKDVICITLRARFLFSLLEIVRSEIKISMYAERSGSGPTKYDPRNSIAVVAFLAAVLRSCNSLCPEYKNQLVNELNSSGVFLLVNVWADDRRLAPFYSEVFRGMASPLRHYYKGLETERARKLENPSYRSPIEIIKKHFDPLITFREKYVYFTPVHIAIAADVASLFAGRYIEILKFSDDYEVIQKSLEAHAKSGAADFAGLEHLLLFHIMHLGTKVGSHADVSPYDSIHSYERELRFLFSPTFFDLLLSTFHSAEADPDPVHALMVVSEYLNLVQRISRGCDLQLRGYLKSVKRRLSSSSLYRILLAVIEGNRKLVTEKSESKAKYEAAGALHLLTELFRGPGGDLSDPFSRKLSQAISKHIAHVFELLEISPEVNSEVDRTYYDSIFSIMSYAMGPGLAGDFLPILKPSSVVLASWILSERMPLLSPCSLLWLSKYIESVYLFYHADTSGKQLTRPLFL